MNTRDEKPLVLVDGSSYLYRAFHAMPALTNSRGEPTGAVYGVANMLRKLLRDYDPEYVAVVFDAKGKTFRDELYEQYKANRPPMPEELRAQIEPLHAIVRAMGLPVLVVDGVEADDVIGTLAQQAGEAGMDTVVSSGDKDLAQLVDGHVSLVNTMTDTTMDPEGVVEKFGITPEQVPDYLALIGDPVDNIPGVPKVGPKTAAKWLKQYGNLENLIAHADEIGGKVGEQLRNSLDQLPLSRKLVSIKQDVALGLRPEELKRQVPDREALREWYSRLEFRSWLAEILAERAGPMETSGGADERRYHTIWTEEELDAWIDKVQTAGLFAFDTETTSLSYMDAEMVGMSFAVEEGEAAYLPVAHCGPDAPQQLSRDWVLRRLRPLLEAADPAKLGHNLKYDASVLARYGIELAGIRHDTMLESYVLDSTATRHDLDSLALKYLSRGTIHYEDVTGRGKEQIRFDEVPVDQACDYAAEDADVALALHRRLWPQLESERGLRRIYEELEMPLVPVLSRMERNGVLVDAEMLRSQSEVLARRMEEVQEQAFDLAGEPFNLGSPKQIQVVLFEKLGLPVLRKTPKGQPSTAEYVLQELAVSYPLPRLILEHRGLSKLKSTYTDKLPAQIHARTGRVHTSYHQAVAATGRLSSSDPNLQNIPIRTPEGRRIRQAFVASPGCSLVAADYSQIELRIMAHLSGDPGLLKAFAGGEDIHRATAAEVFALDPEEVTDAQRRSAKAINFGLIYGMSAYGLGRQLGIERAEAEEYIQRYFARYPGVKRFMEQTRARARELGYVETVFGRRLYVPEINVSNTQRRQYAERTAINAPMQGTAADIIKKAMIATDAWIRAARPDIKMIMQVHDELVFEIPDELLDAAHREIHRSMVQAAELDVPLVVEIGIGRNWDEAH